MLLSTLLCFITVHIIQGQTGQIGPTGPAGVMGPTVSIPYNNNDNVL